jgi:hypothetical protein
MVESLRFVFQSIQAQKQAFKEQMYTARPGSVKNKCATRIEGWNNQKYLEK